MNARSRDRILENGNSSSQRGDIVGVLSSSHVRQYDVARRLDKDRQCQQRATQTQHQHQTLFGGEEQECGNEPGDGRPADGGQQRQQRQQRLQLASNGFFWPSGQHEGRSGGYNSKLARVPKRSTESPFLVICPYLG